MPLHRMQLHAPFGKGAQAWLAEAGALTCSEPPACQAWTPAHGALSCPVDLHSTASKLLGIVLNGKRSRQAEGLHE